MLKFGKRDENGSETREKRKERGFSSNDITMDENNNQIERS